MTDRFGVIVPFPDRATPPADRATEEEERRPRFGWPQAEAHGRPPSKDRLTEEDKARRLFIDRFTNAVRVLADQFRGYEDSRGTANFWPGLAEAADRMARILEDIDFDLMASEVVVLRALLDLAVAHACFANELRSSARARRARTPK